LEIGEVDPVDIGVVAELSVEKRQMVQAAEDWLTGHGIPRAMLLVRETNQMVIGFYEQLGFEAIPRTLMRKVLAEKP